MRQAGSSSTLFIIATVIFYFEIRVLYGERCISFGGLHSDSLIILGHRTMSERKSNFHFTQKSHTQSQNVYLKYINP